MKDMTAAADASERRLGTTFEIKEVPLKYATSSARSHERST
jgi:hypothetical protein